MKDPGARIHITGAEVEVMAALWRHGPLTPASLLAAVKDRRDWGEPTIKTLLGRLMRKKAVRSVREGARLLYHPLVSRDAHRVTEIESLIERLFDGDEAALRAFLESR
jgi:predicted transcriptional regulator